MGTHRHVVPGAESDAVARSARTRTGRAAARPPSSSAALLDLQRRAGNAAVSRVVAGTDVFLGGPVVQREDAPTVAVISVSLNNDSVTVPPSAGLNVTATAKPKKATGVAFSLAKGTVEASGTTIDSASGRLTVTASQPGGYIDVKATSDDGSYATAGLRIIQKPTALASTTASDIGSASEYGGAFVHTFTGAGEPAGLEGARINETFTSLVATMPWGGKFTLAANKAGSKGWGLDSAAAMTGDDQVTIATSGVDIRPLIASASNPAPKQTLPAKFSMTQHLKAQSLPGKKWDETAFAKTDHVRGVEEAEGVIKVFVKSGDQTVSTDYVGKPAYRKATASAATVSASAPKPVAKKGESVPDWQRETVTVTAEVLPAAAPITYSIVEKGAARLGCEIDAATGVVKIGSKPGTITVRASDGTARPGHYDQVKIQITPRPAPPADGAAANAAARTDAAFAEAPL